MALGIGVRISPECSEHCEAMSLEGCAPALPFTATNGSSRRSRIVKLKTQASRTVGRGFQPRRRPPPMASSLRTAMFCSGIARRL